MVLVTNTSQVIEVPVTKEMMQFAKENYHQGSMNEYSMLGGDRNLEGYLGELAVAQYFPMLAWKPNKNYDFKMPEGSRVELTIDVKNKHVKRRLDPSLDWECTIYGYEATKVCNLYLFTSTNWDRSIVWLKGFQTKRTLVVDSNYYRAGSFVRSSQGAMRMKEDNYLTKVSNLGCIEHLKRQIEKVLTKPQDSANL